MNWLKKIFKSKKAAEQTRLSKDEEVLNKLEVAITNCKSEIKKTENEVEQIRSWAIDAIKSSFEVPKEFWYEELKKYEHIRELEINKNLDPQVIEKCNKVINGYSGEIELRKMKIQLYKSLIMKYEVSFDKMMLIKNENNKKNIAKLKLKELDNHSLRLESLRNDPENLPDHIEASVTHELIKEEIQEVYTEFEISEEVRKSIVEINQQFKTQDKNYDSIAAIEEIKTLLKKLNNDTKAKEF